MTHAEAVARPDDDPMTPEPMRMGSEYSDAASYLYRPARRAGSAARQKSAKDPQHGSNDSDFGIPDQRHD